MQKKRYHTLSRLYVDQPLSPDTSIALPRAHYLDSVMRRKVGDTLLLFNGKDGEWHTTITQLSRKSAICHVQEQTRPQRAEPDIWLVFAPLKQARMQYLFERGTELGVSCFVPILTHHSIVDKFNTEKAIQYVTHASEQCERFSVPNIMPLQPLSECLNDWDASRKLMMCDESGHGENIYTALDNAPPQSPYAVLVGPEGGFSETEGIQLRSLPFAIPVGLGPRILRADTAALAALSCFQAALGDWDASPEYKYEKYRDV